MKEIIQAKQNIYKSQYIINLKYAVIMNILNSWHGHLKSRIIILWI